MMTRMNRFSMMNVHRIMYGKKNRGDQDDPQFLLGMQWSASVSMVSFIM